MQIIIQRPNHQDIDDYSAFRGTVDAILDQYSETLFNLDSEAARACRSIYELAYEFEKHSHCYEHGCHFEVEAIVRDYNDLKGWGSLYADELLGLLPFSYREIPDDQFILEGDKVLLRFKYNENYKIQAVKITRIP